MTSRCVLLVANDKVLDWVLPLVDSIRAFDPDWP